MHDRYMRVPAVSRWLMARDALTDFHVVRQDLAVLVSTSPSSPPQFPNASSLPDVPFPASNDLAFPDDTVDGFTFGHVRCTPM